MVVVAMSLSIPEIGAAKVSRVVPAVSKHEEIRYLALHTSCEARATPQPISRTTSA